MPYKNVFVQNDTRLGIKNGQLHIINDNDTLIPLEDIATILIESPQCVILVGKKAKYEKNSNVEQLSIF